MRFEEGISLEKGIDGIELTLLFCCNQPEEVFPPAHETEEGVEPQAGVRKAVEAVGQLKPENLHINFQIEEDLGFGAGFPSAFFSIVHPVPQIKPGIPRRMEQTADAFVFLVQIAERPAAESGDGDDSVVFVVELTGVFPENPPDDVSILLVLITGRSYRRAAGKAGFFIIGRT